jgi:glyoxalase family protein
MDLTLGGLHHLTAITADAPANVRFYTQVLGLRLVKKTVNQDDTSAYHLFYGDGAASPGSDITFFDWPAPRESRGTHAIVRTAFRVAEGSLGWWAERLKAANVAATRIADRGGRPALAFEDGEGQRLELVADAPGAETHPWERSPVPVEHQLRGLGPITLSVPRLETTSRVLTAVMNMREAGTYTTPEHGGAQTHVFEMGPGGPAAELHVIVEPEADPAGQGAGGVHHVAFRTPDYESLAQWTRRLSALRIPSSGEVERYYFRSLYFREPNGILFEIATDIPGFAADEPLATLGEKLSLPPFLEPRREQIERRLKPIT